MMRRSDMVFSILVCLSFTVIISVNTCSLQEKKERPNILLIVADDLGYGDVSCFRGDLPWESVVPSPEKTEGIQTPVLDMIAQKGIMLTDFHSNCATCSPTRASIMTGRYNHRTGITNVLGQLGNAMKKVARPGEEPFLGLLAEEVTIAEVLKDGGYCTACFGKWHLGPLDTHNPLDHGFDIYIGTEGGAGDNFSMKNRDGKSYFYRNREPAEAPGYWFADVLADEVIKFITEKSDQPFFVYLPFTTPHLPYVGPGDREIVNVWDEQGLSPREDLYQAYKDVVEGMDASIGRIYKTLEKFDLDRNTIVIFTSDNGPVDYGSPGQFRGRKTNLYEAGTRVPTIISWPGKIRSGIKSDQLCMTMDLFPTLAAISGCRIPDTLKLDGTDLSAMLTNGDKLKPRMLFWERPTGVMMDNFDIRRFAVRDGQWKLLQDRTGKPFELYNLATDPGERMNIAENYPERVDKMKSAFEKWKQDVYSDSPWDYDELLIRLEQAGIIKK